MGATPPLQLQPSIPAGFAPRDYESNNQTQGQSEADKQEIERLRSTCALWKAYSPQWDLYLRAYEGGPDLANEQHLFKHQRENDDDFLDRVKRIHYINYCDVLVDFFTHFIFAETIQRDAVDNADFYEQFRKNVDFLGSDIDAFMRSVCDYMQIDGMFYVLVDTPKPPDVEVLTKQVEQDHNLRPYWIPIRADEVTDWIVNDFENFLYVKRKQIKERLDGRIKTVVEEYTEWTPDEITTSAIDVTDPQDPKLLPSTTTNNKLGFIPIEVIRFKRSRRYPYMGNSFLRDFAYNNREIMNLTSLLQEFLYRQAFNILVKETDTAIPTASQEDGVMGTANVLEYPRGAKPPQYIYPPADPAKFISDERERIKQEMFRRAAQDTLNELFNGEKSSGFSQAQSFSKTVPFIASRADVLEDAENRLMTLTMRFLNKKWDGKIKYKDRYEITSLTDAVTQLAMLAQDLQIQSKTFFSEEMKRLVQEFDGKMTSEIKATVLKEIDATNWSEWFDTQKQALIGAPNKGQGVGGTPAARQKTRSTGSMAEVSVESKKQGGSSTRRKPKASS